MSEGENKNPAAKQDLTPPTGSGPQENWFNISEFIGDQEVQGMQGALDAHLKKGEWEAVAYTTIAMNSLGIDTSLDDETIQKMTEDLDLEHFGGQLVQAGRLKSLGIDVPVSDSEKAILYEGMQQIEEFAAKNLFFAQIFLEQLIAANLLGLDISFVKTTKEQMNGWLQEIRDRYYSEDPLFVGIASSIKQLGFEVVLTNEEQRRLRQSLNDMRTDNKWTGFAHLASEMNILSSDSEENPHSDRDIDTPDKKE